MQALLHQQDSCHCRCQVCLCQHCVPFSNLPLSYMWAQVHQLDTRCHHCQVYPSFMFFVVPYFKLLKIFFSASSQLHVGSTLTRHYVSSLSGKIYVYSMCRVKYLNVLCDKNICLWPYQTSSFVMYTYVTCAALFSVQLI